MLRITQSQSQHLLNFYDGTIAFVFILNTLFQQARAALTELFESIKTQNTPIVVENVVNDIDNNVVDIVRRFSNAFKTVTGQNEVRKMLRTILWLKYKIKDNEVFEKAYKYVEMYYTPGGSDNPFQPSAKHIDMVYDSPEDNIHSMAAENTDLQN